MKPTLDEEITEIAENHAATETDANEEWAAIIKSAIYDGIEAWKRREPEIPLCGDHARTWFTERNHLAGGMDAVCVVCAHQSDASLRTSETTGEG